MLRTAFLAALFAHAAIHLMGFVKAFGLAALPQLTLPIGRPLGLLWLVAALAFAASGVLLAMSSHAWPLVAAPALVASQIAIVTSWGDARLGTVPNLIALAPIAIALLDLRPTSLRSTYLRETSRTFAGAPKDAPVTDADLAPLPPLVQTYLRRAGAVGRAHVASFRARFHGRIRGKVDGPWMEFRAEQHNALESPLRLFFLEARSFGVPFDVFHRYVGAEATMQVRAASLVEVVHAGGPEMTQSETVTLFNDMCVLAPAMLVDAKVAWKPIDERTVGATFANAGHTITALLSFDADGDLVGFVSNDRYQTDDGKTFRRLPWSTPLSGYRDYGVARLARHGEAAWLGSDGGLVYGHFELESIAYNVGVP